MSTQDIQDKLPWFVPELNTPTLHGLYTLLATRGQSPNQQACPRVNQHCFVNHATPKAVKVTI